MGSKSAYELLEGRQYDCWPATFGAHSGALGRSARALEADGFTLKDAVSAQLDAVGAEFLHARRFLRLTEDNVRVERKPVASDSLASVGHDARTSVLEIRFTNGSVYRYFAVPRSVFDRLMLAPSKGTFFVDQIKDVFAFQRVS